MDGNSDRVWQSPRAWPVAQQLQQQKGRCYRPAGPVAADRPQDAATVRGGASATGLRRGGGPKAAGPKPCHASLAGAELAASAASDRKSLAR